MLGNHRTESIVRERYAAGAKASQVKLCCPVDYDAGHLKVIPQEVLERDYGCGDPSKYLREGEIVLDLGSGTGKICFIAAQIVGPKGKVIGVDMTDEMLEVARRNAPIVAQRIGYANVEFHKGRIQDLALDLEKLDEALKKRPITDAASFLRADDLAEELRVKNPLAASDSIDVVVSNCVLNLVESRSKRTLFDEIFRVLKKGGRAVISDIVSDEDVLETAGFYGIQILKRDAEPWRSVQGIEFRSVTIEAFKGKQGECFERNQAVIYRGPFKEVLDDDNHRMERGKRYAVCDKTYNLYRKAPYQEFFQFVDPIVDVPLVEAKPFDCSRTSLRHPKETKGQDYDVTTEANNQCCDGGSCC